MDCRLCPPMRRASSSSSSRAQGDDNQEVENRAGSQPMSNRIMGGNINVVFD